MAEIRDMTRREAIDYEADKQCRALRMARVDAGHPDYMRANRLTARDLTEHERRATGND